MSRRDTIIIAVLVNAALLMILFATSKTSDDPKTLPHQDPSLLAEAEGKQMQAIDPLEEVLSQYVKAPLTTPEPIAEVVFSDALSIPAEPVKKQTSPAPTLKTVPITVKKGDVLEKIAKANGSSVAAIMQANELSSTKLKIGQLLQVPLQPGEVKRASVSAPEEYYVVKDGDNPWLIASKNRVKLDELLRLNGLDEAKARRLRPGDKLRLR